jgi:hypothetical protein
MDQAARAEVKELVEELPASSPVSPCGKCPAEESDPNWKPDATCRLCLTIQMEGAPCATAIA